MANVLKRICSALSVVGGLLLLFITFSIGYSIVTRKLNLPTPVWVVQFNEYALLWVTFLATAWILSRDGHVSVQVLMQFMGRKGKRVLDLIHSFMGMCLCGIFCWYGVYSTWDHYVRKVMDVTSVDVPKSYIILIIPLGFGLLCLQFLLKFFTALSGKEIDGTVNTSRGRGQESGKPAGAESAGNGGKK